MWMMSKQNTATSTGREVRQASAHPSSRLWGACIYLAVTMGGHSQGALYYQPKQCSIREIPQNDHRFVLLDPPPKKRVI